LALIVGLPADSAYAASVQGGSQFRGWDAKTYAQVATVNALRSLTHLFLLANSNPKKSKPKPQDPFPTPHDDVRKKQKKHGPGSFAAIAASMMKKKV
jgi:hypothetical protein